MRRQALEATHYIPYKLIQSLSNNSTILQNQSTTTVEGKARVEKEVQIRLENDILKYGINDSILVNAAVIWLYSSSSWNRQRANSCKDSSNLKPNLKFITRETSSWLMKSTIHPSRFTLSFTLHSFHRTLLSGLVLRDLIGRWRGIGKSLHGLLLKSMPSILPIPSLRK